MPNCVHGFAQNECLICRTLGTTSGAPKASSSSKGASKTKTAELSDIDQMLAERTASLPATRGGKAKTAAEAKRGMTAKQALWGGLFLVVVAGVVWVVFGSLFSLAFHLFEYAVVAVAAGWLGYRLGHARGRRGH